MWYSLLIQTFLSNIVTSATVTKSLLPEVIRFWLDCNLLVGSSDTERNMEVRTLYSWTRPAVRSVGVNEALIKVKPQSARPVKETSSNILISLLMSSLTFFCFVPSKLLKIRTENSSFFLNSKPRAKENWNTKNIVKNYFAIEGEISLNVFGNSLYFETGKHLHVFLFMYEKLEFQDQNRWLLFHVKKIVSIAWD